VVDVVSLVVDEVAGAQVSVVVTVAVVVVVVVVSGASVSFEGSTTGAHVGMDASVGAAPGAGVDVGAAPGAQVSPGARVGAGPTPASHDGSGASVIFPGGRGSAVRGAAVGSAVGATVVVVFGTTYTGVVETDCVRSAVPVCECVLRDASVGRSCVSDVVNVAAHAPMADPHAMKSTLLATVVGTVVDCCAVEDMTRVLDTAGVQVFTVAMA
jgi:hypothetical protein